jgi:hypothetical protein
MKIMCDIKITQTIIVWFFLIFLIETITIEGAHEIGKVANMAVIIPFKTKKQLETEKRVKVMREWETHLEWEEANWLHVIERETEESEIEIG